MEKTLGMRREYLVALVLVLITLALFSRVLGYQFVYDDKQYIQDNPQVRDGLSFKDIGWAFTSMYAFNWHPLTWLSHMLDCTLFGQRAGLHHLINLFFHAANVFLLFFVLMQLTASMWRSAFVAALFAVHPLHVESVAWVAERKDMLSTFFMLLTIWAYNQYVNAPDRKKYAFVVGFFLLGLLSKPMLVTLPFVLLLLDYWPLGRIDFTYYSLLKDSLGRSKSKRLLLEKIPLFGLSLFSCIITYIAQQHGGAVGSLEQFPFSARIGNAMLAYVGYIAKMIVPYKLSIFYPHPGLNLQIWKVVAATLFLVIITAFVIKAAPNRRYLLVGWFWYLGTLVPVLGLVQVGMQAMADRYTYITLIGLFIIIAWGVPDLVEYLGKRYGMKGQRCADNECQAGVIASGEASTITHSQVLPVCACIIILSLMVCTWRQLSYWKDNFTLFGRAVEITGGNYLMENNLGFFLMEAGRHDEAIKHFRAALRDNPRYAEAHVNIGNILSEQGKTEEALREYQAALKVRPGFAPALNNIAGILEQKGQMIEAMHKYEEAVKADPSSATSHLNFGRLLILVGRPDDAIRELTEAVRLDPKLELAHYNLARLLIERGRLQDALPHLEEVVRLNPTNAEAHLDLGAVLVDMQRIDEGIAHYIEVIKLKPDFPPVHNNLAVAYFFKGQYAAAWEEVKLCRKYGMTPHPEFIKALSSKMPEP
ncbi:MAG: tetratricopeptide repeat protein [Armatimonadota bacterium]|nr:tetratricopeptide repeat protein [Armatimonadota bacterium]